MYEFLILTPSCIGTSFEIAVASPRDPHKLTTVTSNLLREFLATAIDLDRCIHLPAWVQKASATGALLLLNLVESSILPVYVCWWPTCCSCELQAVCHL